MLARPSKITCQRSFAQFKIGVYPNPAVDYLNVSIPKLQEDMKFALYDMQGKLIEQQNILSSSFKIGFNQMSTGSYLLVFSSKDQRIKTLQVQKSH